MNISPEAIRELRGRTGAGIMDCKRALEDSRGDLVAATEALRHKGLALAASKATRVATQGVIAAYLHAGSRIGALVEVNCETDFVARTKEFQELAHNLAMQVAAMKPLVISPQELPSGTEARPEEACLMLQPFIKDPQKKVQDIVTEAVARTGENIKVKRFVRFELGS
ncbi:MAG: translation elongation factor Ts [Chloroflexi bacterium]|nr:translation elongation factor Ts [Chloroflexota bacterium]